jgi:AraC-like DNA-binding protein
MGSTAGGFTGEKPLLQFRSDDIDEVGEFVGRHFGDHSRVPQRPGPLGYEILASRGPRSFAGLHSQALPTTVRAAMRSITVHLPMQRGAEYRVGRRLLRSAANVAVLLAPGADYTLRAAPDRTHAFGLDASLLEQELGARRGARAGSWYPQCLELPLTPAESAEFRRLTDAHVGADGSDPDRLGFEAIGTIERQYARWLATRIAETAGLAPLSVSSRDVAERVEAWIRGHVSQAITLEQLTAVAGVSGRTLQKACLARWGQTPLELVASRRLEVVRNWLAAEPLTVTDAAVRGGFTHLGRFSGLYRQAFGESPSETRAKRRRQAV